MPISYSRRELLVIAARSTAGAIPPFVVVVDEEELLVLDEDEDDTLALALELSSCTARNPAARASNTYSAPSMLDVKPDFIFYLYWHCVTALAGMGGVKNIWPLSSCHVFQPPDVVAIASSVVGLHFPSQLCPPSAFHPVLLGHLP